MHLTQQKQLNPHQMCPPPIGSSTAWFMNFPTTGIAQTPTSGVTYHNYNHQNQSSQAPQNHQNYYDVNPIQSQTLSTNATIHNQIQQTNQLSSSRSGNNIARQQTHLQHPPNHQSTHHHQHHSQSQTVQHQQHHNNHHHHQQQQHLTQSSLSHHHRHQLQQNLTHHQVNPPHYNYSYSNQTSQSHQQHQNSSQSYNSISVHHQPLTIQQPQPQHVHQQQSPILSQPLQSQLSPHTSASQPRPSPTLHQHPQPSPNYQQHSPHLTSPSLQPSPVLHHHSQQPSPSTRLQQQTPPHHTPTPLSQHYNSRPASVKESINIANTNSFLSDIPQTELRMLEFNRRLQNRPVNANYRVSPLPTQEQADDVAWWHEFIGDFFRDDATLTLELHHEERPLTYILRRALITKFFKSYFIGGVTDMSFNVRNAKETRNGQSLVLDCEQAAIVTKNIPNHPKMNGSKIVVCSEGHLMVEFICNGLEPLMIKSWWLRLTSSKEYIDRSVTGMGLTNTILIEPTTIQGLPESTISYLRLCSILEPMQDIMTQQKLSHLDPKSCLKKYLFEKHRFVSEEDSKMVSTKRRKRKQDSSPKSTASPKKSKAVTSTNSAMTQRVPPIPELPPVSIVGEPISMAKYRFENERLISKIENTIYTDDIKVVPEVSKIDDVDSMLSSLNNNDETVERTSIPESLDPAENEIDTTNKAVLEFEPNFQIKSDPVTKTPVKVEESCNEESSSRPVSEEPSEKENNGPTGNEEFLLATQSEGHFNIVNCIPVDRGDSCKTSDLVVSKLPSNVSNKISVLSNGSNSKQSRRRSNEKREKLCDGLMRTCDFVVAIKDLKFEHPPLWRITTGNNLLQQFEPKTINGVVLYENTNQYAGWNPEIKRDYVGVDVKVLSHNRNQILAERLQLNFQNLDDSENFHDKHFLVYLQILISTALDPKFWESIETEPKHHDYFLTSRKIIDEIIKRHKMRLSSKLKLNETMLKNFEKYPNLIIKSVEEDKQAQTCRACNINLCTQIVSFGNRSYDLHSYKPVKVTSEPSKIEDEESIICDSCLSIVKLYSEVHHMGWKFFNSTLEKVDQLRSRGKPVNAILDECLNDEEWINKNYAERDALWSKIDQVH